MIFAFVEDGTLEVHADLLGAQVAHEGIDVESGSVHFYDATGTCLEPVFTVPNRHAKIFGIGWVSSGEFQLVAKPDSGQDSFALALYETKVLLPNRWFTSLGQLKAELSSKGVMVDYRAK